MISGIYKITINGKDYIGSAVNIKVRINRHLLELRRNIHKNKKVQNHYNKYGESTLSYCVLENCERDLLLKREQHYFDTLNPFLNICKTAGSPLGRKHTEEAKKKMSLDRIGKVSSIGWKHSAETRKVLSEMARIRGISDKMKQACIIANTGRKHKAEDIYKKTIKQTKLNCFQVYDIRKKLKDGIYQHEIAKEYDVSQRVIAKINLGIGIYGKM